MALGGGNKLKCDEIKKKTWLWGHSIYFYRLNMITLNNTYILLKLMYILVTFLNNLKRYSKCLKWKNFKHCLYTKIFLKYKKGAQTVVHDKTIKYLIENYINYIDLL